MRTCQKCKGTGTIQPDGEPAEEGSVVAALKCPECNGEGVTRTIVDDLRALADFLEARPNFPILSVATFNAFAYDKQRFLNAARTMGKARKLSIDDWFYLRKRFGDINLDLCVMRALVCTRRGVGTKTIPAKPAKPERVVPVYEWDCPKVLGGQDADEAAALAGSNQPEDEEAQHDEVDEYDSDREAQATDEAYERARDAGTLPDEVDEHGVRIEPE